MSTLMPTMESLTELLRRADITSKARYAAARRMEEHSAFSQWTLAILAVGQLVISLIVALKLRINFSPAYVDFSAIFFGILVLTYSLLLGMGNYAARAIKLHLCGIELGGLSRSLHLKCRDAASTSEDYEKAASKYYEILSKCENHKSLDYLLASRDGVNKKLSDAKLFSTAYFRVKVEAITLFVEIWVKRAIEFSHYLGSIALIGWWIYVLAFAQK